MADTVLGIRNSKITSHGSNFLKEFHSLKKERQICKNKISIRCNGYYYGSLIKAQWQHKKTKGLTLPKKKGYGK